MLSIESGVKLFFFLRRLCNHYVSSDDQLVQQQNMVFEMINEGATATVVVVFHNNALLQVQGIINPKEIKIVLWLQIVSIIVTDSMIYPIKVH